VAEAHRLLLAGQHGEGVARGGVNHHQLDRVRADIYRGEFHSFYFPRALSVTFILSRFRYIDATADYDINLTSGYELKVPRRL
jgi:hypothetical protein